MEKIPVFDARVSYGRDFLKADPERDLREEMRLAEAERAVIVSRELRWLPPQRSIPLVEKRVAETLGAWGLYLLLPAITGETPDVDTLAKTMRQKHMAGFYLHPQEYGVPEDPIFLTAELEACQRRRIPVFFHLDRGNYWPYLCDILRAFPKLTMVLSTGEEWPNQRKTYPLLAAYPNLHLCLSEQVWIGVIEDMVAKFGAERLLYSSSWPDRYPGGTVMMVENAGLSEEQKKLIYSGNLERLIGGMDCD